jgi:hypothetical protein
MLNIDPRHLTRAEPAPLRAELIGEAAIIGRLVVRHSGTPVLELCRRLVGLGVDPTTPLHVYRGETLALVVRSIGEAATLEVRSMGNGCPTFVPLKCAGAALARRNRRGVS